MRAKVALGIWLLGIALAWMAVTLLALRLPLFDRVLGGMDQVYRPHKWAGACTANRLPCVNLFKRSSP